MSNAASSRLAGWPSNKAFLHCPQVGALPSWSVRTRLVVWQWGQTMWRDSVMFIVEGGRLDFKQGPRFASILKLFVHNVPNALAQTLKVESNPTHAMTRTTLSRLLLLSLLSGLFTPAQAAEPVATKVEIAHLFSILETSNCQFNRNGSWHDAKEASAHLSTKYKYLQNLNLVPSAEKFIDRAATESSFSNKAYQIKCADNVVQPSGPWFTAALLNYRSTLKVK
jgi:Family of unknown function (DUF5329)